MALTILAFLEYIQVIQLNEISLRGGVTASIVALIVVHGALEIYILCFERKAPDQLVDNHFPWSGEVEHSYRLDRHGCHVTGGKSCLRASRRKAERD